MKMISESDKQFGWDDVNTLLGGIVLVLYVCLKEKDASPAWLYLVTGLLAITIGVTNFMRYRNKRKHGKSAALTFFLCILFTLWGVGFIVQALALLL